MMEYFNQVAKIKACLDKLKARDETQWLIIIIILFISIFF